MIRQTSALLLGLFLFCGHAFAADRAKEIAAQLWDDPEFVRRFVASYGFNSPTEPRISEPEQKLFRDLVPLIQSDPPAAIRSLQNAIKPDSSAALDFTLGNIHFQSGDLANAAVHYRNALKKFPDFMRAHRNLALVNVQINRPQDAINAFVRTVELGGEDSNTFGLMGYCYLLQEKFLAAESAYRKAILFAPDSIDWKLGLARSLMAQHRHRESIVLFDELIQRDPEKAEYWLHQGNEYISEREPMLAAANFEIVKRMGKADAQTLNTLADIYLNEHLTDLALESYVASLKLEPKQNISRALRAADILASHAEWDQCGTLVGQIKTASTNRVTDTERLRILKLESRIALGRGDDQRAVDTLSEIIRSDPLDAEAMLILARHHQRDGAVEKAEALYERAAKIRGYEAEAMVQHAQLLVTRNKYDLAIRLLQRAQEIRPRDNVARYLEQLQRLAKTARS